MGGCCLDFSQTKGIQAAPRSGAEVLLKLYIRYLSAILDLDPTLAKLYCFKFKLVLIYGAKQPISLNSYKSD